MHILRILVIEDNASLLAAVKNALVFAGYSVTTASDGVEAARIFGSEHFDLVITDLIMPRREGIETIAALRRGYPAVRILAMSGGSPQSRAYLDMAAKLGAHATLLKPFTNEQLNASVSIAMGAAE